MPYIISLLMVLSTFFNACDESPKSIAGVRDGEKMKAGDKVYFQILPITPQPASVDAQLFINSFSPTFGLSYRISIRTLDWHEIRVLYNDTYMGDLELNIDCSTLANGSYYVVVDGLGSTQVASLLVLH